MRGSSDQFIGMLITLKKRMMCISEDDTNNYRYLMFGHYDGMDIHCTNQWYQLRPRGVENYGGNVDISDSLWDKYTLKVYFPQRNYCERLEAEGFGYDIWEKLGWFEENREYCNDILKRFPFVSVAMINLSQKFVKKNDFVNKLMESIVDAVKKSVKKSKKESKEEWMSELKSIHCAIMPSVGYADFVLLFLSDNLTKVITVLDYLRQVTFEEGKNHYAMLSNSYAISGFAKVGLEGLQELKKKGCLNDVNLSIRVNLRDGVSAAQFKKFFDDQIAEILRGDALQVRSQEGNPRQEILKTHDLYQVFGNSDCLILSEMSFDFFIPLFYDAKLLNPAHELFRYYIRHTRSSIRVKITAEGTRPADQNNGIGAQEKYQTEFQELISCLRGYAKDQSMPVRTINGLQNVMKTYLNLVQFSHCFDIERIIGDAFKAVKSNVDKSMRLIKEQDDATAFEYSEQMLAALRIFRDKTEEYLADMLRSDRLFIEGQSLSHPSIGSATKLLFFYNKFLNDVAKKLLHAEERKKGNHYTFVVTSGGCDVTTACDVFSYINPSEVVNSLIIISVPEMSLYDIKGTMFRVLHECFHYCGERKRDIRLEKLLESVSESVAVTISQGLRQSLQYYFDVRVLKSLQNKVSEEDWKKAEEQGREYIKENTKNLTSEYASNLCEKLKKKLPKESPEEPEENCQIGYSDMLYGRVLYPYVSEAVKEEILMLDGKKDSDNFLRYVYREFLICQKRVAENMIALFRDMGIPFSKADILRETAENKLCMEEEGLFDQLEIDLICRLFQAIAGEAIVEVSGVEIGEKEQLTIDEILDMLASLFKECFADCMAARMLKLPMEEFVLCFIYETWNMEYVFSDQLRMAIGLKVLYGIEEKMTEENRKKIESRVLHWEKQGFCYQRREGYMDEVCQKVDAALEEYKKGGYVGLGVVEEYLQSCLEFYDENTFNVEARLGELAGMDSCSDIYELLEKVQGMWKNIAEERTEMR